MATSYTSNKKIGQLDSASTPLGLTDEFIVNQSGDTLKTPLSAVEAKVFSSDGKPTQATPSGTEMVIVRQTDNTLRQVALSNIVPASNITNAKVAPISSPTYLGITDDKLATINTAGKVTNTAVQASTGFTGSNYDNAVGANRIVTRDSSGNFAAGTITATLSGNASTATTANNVIDGAITDAKVASGAGILGTKIAPNFGAQNVVTTGGATAGAITVSSAAALFNVNNTSQSQNWQIGSSGSSVFIVNDFTNSKLPFAIEANAPTNAFRIDASGNVGIGTSSPGGIGLHVVKSGTNSAGIIVENGTGSGVLQQGNGALTIAGVSTNPVTIFTNNIERMRIDASGNVGIGTSSPSTFLHVGSGTTPSLSAGTSAVFNPATNSSFFSYISVIGGATNGAAGINFGSTSSELAEGKVLYALGSGRQWMEFSTAGSERMRIDASGNVGIGTSAPTELAHLSGSAAGGNVRALIVNTASDGYSSVSLGDTNAGVWRNGSSQSAYAGSNSINIGTIQAHPVGVVTNNIERIRITATGNCGIGTANPATILDVNGTVTATAFSGPLTGDVTGNVTGNAGTVTGGVYLSGTQTITGRKSFDSASGSGISDPNGHLHLNTLEVLGVGGGAAMMTFHRPGSFAVYLGLNTDNQMAIGGWSLGNNAYPILTSGNYNSYAPTLTGTGASGTWGINITGTAATAANASAIADGVVSTAAKLADGVVSAAKLNGAQTGSAPIFGVRAWAQWSGSLQSQGNVTSITLTNSTASARWYSCTMTNAMPDAQYAVIVRGSRLSAIQSGSFPVATVFSKTTTSFVMQFREGSNVVDPTDIELMVIR